jgi:hypothetical protein
MYGCFAVQWNRAQKRLLALLNDPGYRERLMESLNRNSTAIASPIGGEEQGMKVLSAVNSLVDDHEQYVKSLVPMVEVP